MKPLLLIVMICALFLSVGVAAAQNSQCEGMGGSWVEGKCRFYDDAKISIEYPADIMQFKLIADTVNPFIATSKEEFLQWLASDDNKIISGLPAGPYELDITSQEFHRADNLISLVFTIYEYESPPHGDYYFQTYMFDLETNQLLTLNDLFLSQSDAQSVVVPLAEAEVVHQVGSLAKGHLTLVYPDDYQNVALSDDALLFYFLPGAIPGYEVPIDISIPLSQLKSVLKPEFAP